MNCDKPHEENLNDPSRCNDQETKNMEWSLWCTLPKGHLGEHHGHFKSGECAGIWGEPEDKFMEIEK